jgi:hypothetical protein
VPSGFGRDLGFICQICPVLDKSPEPLGCLIFWFHIFFRFCSVLFLLECRLKGPCGPLGSGLLVCFHLRDPLGAEAAILACIAHKEREFG